MRASQCSVRGERSSDPCDRNAKLSLAPEPSLVEEGKQGKVLYVNMYRPPHFQSNENVERHGSRNARVASSKIYSLILSNVFTHSHILTIHKHKYNDDVSDG